MSKKGGTGVLRVLVVDDSAYNRKMLKAMLMDTEEVGVVDAVSDGEEAIRVVMTDPPDVITLDLNMPRMDGFTFLRWLMRNHPLPVVVVSAEGGEKNVFKALDLGALDFVVKPVRYASERIVEIKQELQEKIRAIAGKDLGPYLNRLKVKKSAEKPAKAAPAKEPRKKSGAAILVVGASTGGPSALQRVLSELPEDYPIPVVVVQHMPPVFTRQFAMRLDRNTSLSGKEASDGDKLTPGTILVVPGGHHLVITGMGVNAKVKIIERQDSDRFVPSVDMTMASAAENFGSRAIGVLLTGMGNDGAEGLLKMKEAGGFTMAESEDSAVVFGMPRAAIQKGAAQDILHLDRIGGRIVELTGSLSGLKNGRSDDTN
jgi:two-component system chemotaxis response regulator CheB